MCYLWVSMPPTTTRRSRGLHWHIFRRLSRQRACCSDRNSQPQSVSLLPWILYLRFLGIYSKTITLIIYSSLFPLMLSLRTFSPIFWIIIITKITSMQYDVIMYLVRYPFSFLATNNIVYHPKLHKTWTLQQSNYCIIECTDRVWRALQLYEWTWGNPVNTEVFPW